MILYTVFSIGTVGVRSPADLLRFREQRSDAIGNQEKQRLESGAITDQPKLLGRNPSP